MWISYVNFTNLLPFKQILSTACILTYTGYLIIHYITMLEWTWECVVFSECMCLTVQLDSV